MPGFDRTTIGLWLAVLAAGLYHGISPGMGWPLAVSAALMDKRRGTLARALGQLAVGHLAAMLLMLLPFTLLASIAVWQRQIQIVASIAVAGFGLLLLVRSRHHPRFLARIPPTRLALWSFAVAIAHGAGLMLVPMYLGLCGQARALPDGTTRLIATDLTMAVAIAVAHTLATLVAGGLLAWLVYRYLGLRFISRSWFNLDALWAASLVLVGALSLAAVVGGE